MQLQFQQQIERHYNPPQKNPKTTTLTSQNLGKSLHPGVHLYELDVVQDLVHFLNTPVSHSDSLPPKVGSESGTEHL